MAVRLPTQITHTELNARQDEVIALFDYKRGPRVMPIDVVGSLGNWTISALGLDVAATAGAQEQVIAIDSQYGTGGDRITKIGAWLKRGGATPPDVNLYYVDLSAPGTFAAIAGTTLVVTEVVGKYQYVESGALTVAIAANRALFLRMISNNNGDGFAGGDLTLDNP